jgi:sugar O-acyltransferase (sialic acid O-acetyltransferase NeuD family)
MNTQRLIILGAGGFGREVCTWAIQSEGSAPWRVYGFLDERPAALSGFDYPVRVLGSASEYVPGPDDVFLCAIGDSQVKRKCCEGMRRKGGSFTTLVHPTALIGRNVQIGVGCIIGPYTQLSCDVTLGNHVAFGTHSNTAHDTRIGDYAQVSGSCEINGAAVLEEGVFLGSHATVLPRARVGAWAFVGAGSVVLRKVRAGSKVFGNPAVLIS